MGSWGVAPTAGQRHDCRGTDVEKELRTLFSEVCNKRWTALIDEPFEFPEGNAVVLQYEDIVDEWDGNIHPNLRRHLDPRTILGQADIILGQDIKSETFFCLFGRERLEEGACRSGTTETATEGQGIITRSSSLSGFDYGTPWSCQLSTLPCYDRRSRSHRS